MTLATSAALQLADIATTALGLSAGAIEANPFSRGLIQDWGLGGWASSKVYFTVCLFVYAWIAPRPMARVRLLIQSANVVLAFVVLSNIGLLLRA